jgi:hypothetical protein
MASLNPPRLRFDGAQEDAQSGANDRSHIETGQFVEFPQELPVGFRQPDRRSLQLRLDETVCTSAATFLKGLYAACIPLIPNVLAFHKVGVPLWRRSPPRAASRFSGRCPDLRAEHRIHQSLGAI